MPAKRYPFVLKERLGEEVYDALVDMVDDRQNDRLVAIDNRISSLNDRFDRVDDRFDQVDERLTGLTVRFDEKLAEMGALFDQKLSTLSERFEHRMADEFGKVRLEINGLRTEMVVQRADLLKWAMVFWVSQAAAVAGIVTVLR
jgi:archaellum component FlaC